MSTRPSITTSVAVALLVAVSTMPLHEVFGDWGWTPTVMGAAVAAAVLATGLESLRPSTPLPVVAVVTATGAAIWALFVSLRSVFWSSPGATATWQALADGVFKGWGALLDEQVPLADARSAETFVAVLAWVATAFGVHVAARRRSALGAIVGAGVVLAAATAAALPTGITPGMIGAAAGAMALVAIATLTRSADQGWRLGRFTALAALIGVAGIVAALGGALSSALDRAPLDPRSSRGVEVVELEIPDVLAEYGVRRDRADTILRIDSSTPLDGLRLRLQVYDRHDGERWIAAADFESRATFPQPEILPPGELITARITLDDLDGPWVPLPDRVIDIDVPDIRWNEGAQTALSSEQPGEYEFTGTQVGRDGLEGLAAAREEVPGELGEVPAALPTVIREIATESTADTDDAVSAVDAITARVRTLGRDESAAPGHSFARLRDDLEAERATGAEQLASIHALMLRSVGVPSRVVVGYVVGGPVVESADLQIWVEAAFPDVGWVAFDPVPAEVETETDTDVEPDPVATTTTRPDDSPLQAQVLPRELGPGEDPEETELRIDDPLTFVEILLLAALAVAVVFALILAVRVARRKIRASLSARPDIRVLGAWAELVDRVRESGAPITDTTTTGDIVYTATALDPELGEHTRALAGHAAAALHAPRASTAADAVDAWEQLRRAEARLSAAAGRTSTARRLLDPRVLRYRAPLPPRTRDGRVPPAKERALGW